jgi:hypothetical protein
MNLPDFTAEESLVPTVGRYRANARAVGQFSRSIGKILPAEVINVHGCAPGSVLVESGDSWDCLPQSLVNWLLNPDTPTGTGTPPLPPGGGGGGNGGPASIPPNIVSNCLLVGGSNGEKYCGGIAGPSCCKSCAQAKCQQAACNATPGCDSSSLNDPITQFCDNCCEDIPGKCKDGLTVKKLLVTGGAGSAVSGGLSGRVSAR